jgi:hypothetical protein
VLKVDPTATNGIVLVIGSSFVQTRQVTVLGATPSASASPSPGASASPSSSTAPPPVTAADPDNRCTI